MEKAIIMIDTGTAEMHETAREWAAQGKNVFVIAKEARVIGNAQVIALNLLESEAVQATAERIAQTCGGIDLLVLGTPVCADDGVIGTGHDDAAMLDTILYSARGNLNLAEACLAHMEGGMKRIACITQRESSNAWSEGMDSLARHQALAGLNMLGKILFNKLRPQGFTFRWFCEGAGGMRAGEYLFSALCYDAEEPYIHSDENRLVMRDGLLREISW